jgi:hypothetical protein
MIAPLLIIFKYLAYPYAANYVPLYRKENAAAKGMDSG